MKYKNYKSAIHNFTHSFISIDYMKSGRLAINVLINLYKLGIENESTFDFIKKDIKPKEGQSKGSEQLMKDYLNWLPEHFEKHNCDLTKLEKLKISIWADFNNAITPSKMNDTKEFKISALTKWKVEGKEEQTLKITQTELINSKYLKVGIPEF